MRVSVVEEMVVEEDKGDLGGGNQEVIHLLPSHNAYGVHPRKESRRKTGRDRWMDGKRGLKEGKTGK